MSHSLAAMMRRMKRMTRPARTTRSVQKAMTGLAMDLAFAPLAASKPKPKPKPKAKPKTAAPRGATAPASPRSLGAVVRQLRAARSLMTGTAAAPRPAATPRIPDGAQYLSRKHRSATGTRDYRLYLPASAPRRPRGLILMLHGCEQTPDDFALGTHMNTLAEKHGMAVAYPAQTSGSNSAACWNWFRPGDQKRDAGEPALLAALARKLMRELGLGRESVFVAGLSAGGAMAAILADVYPEVFSAAGIHSGLARGAAHDVMSAIAAMRRGGGQAGTPPLAPPDARVRRIVFQGDSDRTVHPSNAAMIVAAAVGSPAEPAKVTRRSVRGRGYARSSFAGPDGAVLLELWMLDGAGHAWSGGRAAGSYTDARGPDASVQMMRFFLEKPA